MQTENSPEAIWAVLSSFAQFGGELEFRTFARPLVDLVYSDLSKGDAVQQLFLDVTSYDDAEDNPLRNNEEATYRGYLRQGRGISKIAGLALQKLDTDKFAAKIDGLPTNVIDMLIDAYADELPGATSIDIGKQLAGKFADILKDAKSRGRGGAEPATGSSPVSLPAKDAELFLEANGKCPLCGTPISSEGTARRYKIVGITPAAAKKDYREKRIYEEKVPQMPALGSPEDRIALCLDCAKRYEDDQNPDAFAALLVRKKELRARNDLTAEISSIDLEKTLPVLLAQLGQVRDYKELEKLPMEALQVKEKIDPTEQLLICKIEGLNACFYNFIRSQAQILEQQGVLDFSLLASQIRCCYLKLKNAGLSQEQIFSRICSWIVLKTGSERDNEPEALAAFFVQNCEVFDAIAR